MDLPWYGRLFRSHYGGCMPSDIKVGVVDVAIGGVAIEGFMQEEVTNYLQTAEDWPKNTFAAYDNDPYQRLVDMAKKAQQ